MTQLYLLSSEMAALQAVLADAEEVPEDLAQRLDALDMELKAKVDGCCRVLRHLESEADRFDLEAARMRSRSLSAKAKAHGLKSYIDRCLQQAGIDRVDTELFTLRRQLCPPSVRLLDGVSLHSLPLELLREPPPELNKAACLELFKAGKPLPPGVEVTQSVSLRIS